MTVAVPRVRIGLAVPTIGRPAIAALLESAAGSTLPPSAVAIADQSFDAVTIPQSPVPFDVVIVPSHGGASAGRNVAAAALGTEVDVLGFPNDDSWYPPETLAAVASRFATDPDLDALACAQGGPTRSGHALPPPGAPLDRSSVWRAIEWATFIRREVFLGLGGFDERFGTGGPTPWQSGEITDLLLRLLARGGRVISAPDVIVEGAGERRNLTDAEFVHKHRRYARGTGFVYRTHPYPLHTRLGIVVAPWLRWRSFQLSFWLTLRVVTARSVGRIEGLLGRPLGRAGPA